MPTPEEMAQLEKSRTISDANLLKDGAEYEFNEKGEKVLKITETQQEELHDGFEREEREKVEAEKKEKLREKVENYFATNKIKKLASVFITTRGGEELAIRFHSLDGNYLTGIDNKNYYGSASFMRQRDAEREDAIKKDVPNERISIDSIKELRVNGVEKSLNLSK